MTVRKLLWTTSAFLLAVAAFGSWAPAADRDSEAVARVEARIQLEDAIQVLGPQSDDTELRVLMGVDLEELDPTLGTEERQLFQNPAPCPGPVTYNGTMGVNQAGKRTYTQNRRIYRNGVPSQCSPAKAYPGAPYAGTYYYDVWDFDAFSSDQCITVTINGGSCGSGYNVHPATFCGYFPQGTALPPSNTLPMIRYKGDSGSSPAANQNVTFSFCIGGNVPWSLVATNVYSLQACTYSITIRCANGSCPPDPNCPLAYTGCNPDRMAPRVSPPAGGAVPCDAVPPVPPLSSVVVTDNCDVPPPAPVYEGETRTAGNCPGNYTLTRTWRATDQANNVGRGTQVLQVQDRVGPVGIPAGTPIACTWPPNHTLVAIDSKGFDFTKVQAIDNCDSTPFTYALSGLDSDQCDNAPCSQYPGQNGDGETTNDFFLPEGGQSVVVRSERCGTEEGGRHYGLLLTPRDSCGNVGQPFKAASILVPHDSADIPAGMTCVDASKAGTK